MYITTTRIQLGVRINLEDMSTRSQAEGSALPKLWQWGCCLHGKVDIAEPKPPSLGGKHRRQASIGACGAQNTHTHTPAESAPARM